MSHCTAQHLRSEAQWTEPTVTKSHTDWAPVSSLGFSKGMGHTCKPRITVQKQERSSGLFVRDTNAVHTS